MWREGVWNVVHIQTEEYYSSSHEATGRGGLLKNLSRYNIFNLVLTPFELVVLSFVYFEESGFAVIT